jgi:ankyrin repeat protein
MNRNCLCEQNQVDCRVCAEHAYKAWKDYQSRNPHDTPCQQVERAIQDDQPYVVLGFLQTIQQDINVPCEPQAYESVSLFTAALRADKLRIAELIAHRPGFNIHYSLPDVSTWDWAEDCSLNLLQFVSGELGEDINRQDHYGSTLLHAVVHDQLHPEKLGYLLQQENLKIDIAQADNTTPLYQAALYGNTEAVEMLLQFPVNINNANADNHWSILIVSVVGDHTAIVERILQHPDINVNAQSDLQETALHSAAELGHLQSMALLLAHPTIDINIKNYLGLTALSKAAITNQLDNMRLLLACPKIEVNFVDQSRQTALHWAVLSQNFDAVHILLTHPQTNPHITNRPDHQTAYEMAVALGLKDIIVELQQALRNRPGLDELSPNDLFTEHEEEDLPQPILKRFIPEPANRKG